MSEESVKTSALENPDKILESVQVRPFSTINDLEKAANGPKNVDEIVQELQYQLGFKDGKKEGIAEGYEQGRRDGADQVVDKLKESLFKTLSESFTNIVYTKELVAELTKDTFSTEQLAIEDVRAKLPSQTNDLNLFFLVKCKDFKTELLFGRMVTSVQSYLLTQKRIYSDIHFAADSETLNYSSVKTDYPFSFK
jgi:hypothetical protein